MRCGCRRRAAGGPALASDFTKRAPDPAVTWEDRLGPFRKHEGASKVSQEHFVGRLSHVSQLSLTHSFALLTIQEEFAATFFFVMFPTSKAN